MHGGVGEVGPAGLPPVCSLAGGRPREPGVFWYVRMFWSTC